LFKKGTAHGKTHIESTSEGTLKN